MCGISVIFAYGVNSSPVDREELCRTSDAMSCRGPDGSGAWCAADGRIAMAHRRLAIIDLSTDAAQPMVSLAGRFVTVCDQSDAA